jgi:hypothetical protein
MRVDRTYCSRHVGTMRKLALLTLFLVAACTDGGAARRAFLASLVGQPEAEIVRQLGVPTRTFATEGRTFLAYNEHRIDIIPGTPGFGAFGGFGGRGGYGYGARLGYFGGGFPPEVVEYGCETTFEIAGGRAVSFSLRGNSCG